MVLFQFSKSLNRLTNPNKKAAPFGSGFFIAVGGEQELIDIGYLFNR